MPQQGFPWPLTLPTTWPSPTDVDLNVSPHLGRWPWYGTDLQLNFPVVIFDRLGVPATTFGFVAETTSMLPWMMKQPLLLKMSVVPVHQRSMVPLSPTTHCLLRWWKYFWELGLLFPTMPLATQVPLTVGGLTYSYEVASTPLQVILDANGMATLDASALLMSVDRRWITP